jgi:signal transduction histidine kinase
VATAFDRMAHELALREQRLVQTERMAVIGQLAAGVAHELNNPIGIIRGYLKTMDPEGDIRTLRQELGILDEEAAHCQRIADDLLTYASVQKLDIRRIHMKDFLEESIRRLREGATSGAVDLRLAVEPYDLEADPVRLRQVVANLVVNAGQASPPGATVEVIGRPGDDGGYEVMVSDRGPGIEEHDKQRIFEPFFTKRSGGSGLGLALCLGITRAHGGSIVAENRQGGGTNFRLWLPATPPALEENELT